MARGKAAKKPRTRRRRPSPTASVPVPRAAFVGVRRAVLLVAALLAVAASVGLFVVYPSARGPGEGRAVELVAVANPSPRELADMLAASGLLSHPALFTLWVRATGGTGGVVPGVHLLTDDATPGELLARLERRPGGGTARVTFPEGWNRFDMAKRLQDRHVVPLRDFLEATTDAVLLRELGIDGDSAEGFLFPATYELSLDDDAKDVVRRMKREFDRRWDLASSAHGASLSDVMASAKISAREVVTLASIVEKEAVVDDERPLIASVFLNRMRDPSFKPKRLESDPTAAYGCLVAPEHAPSCATFSGKPTAAIEHDPGNPYSTYTHDGFPPGPIANAGYKSIEAAMAPATSHFYFFVARGEGRHTFSETYEAHAAAVRDGGAKAGVK
jgi:UPF0755 protein